MHLLDEIDVALLWRLLQLINLSKIVYGTEIDTLIFTTNCMPANVYCH